MPHFANICATLALVAVGALGVLGLFVGLVTIAAHIRWVP